MIDVLAKTNPTPPEPIRTTEELEFSVFCIESIAERLGVEAPKVYQALAQKSDILNQYIVPSYDVLHTQDKKYIVNDILDVIKERGVTV